MHVVCGCLCRGYHLVNFEADHSELLGINPFLDFPLMVSLIEDTANSVTKAETSSS